MNPFESANMFTWFTMSGLETTEPRIGVLNLANASSRSIESFFSVSNEKVDGGEAVQKRQGEKDLDSELENVDGVAELRKRSTESKTRSYEKKFCLDIGWTISAIHFNVMHDSAMKKILTISDCTTVCFIAEDLLYCV